MAESIKQLIKNLIFAFFKLMPLKNNYIIFESEGDLCDNSYAYFMYLRKNGYDKKYTFIWAVEDIDAAMKRNVENIRLIGKSLKSIRTMYYLAIAKYFIYDHSNLYAHVKKRSAQRLIFLDHGVGFKSGKQSDVTLYKSDCEFLVTTGELGGDIEKAFYNYSGDVEYFGYPRNDYFYSDLSEQRSLLEREYNFSAYDKVILWMPTFRKCSTTNISETYLDCGTGLPLLTTGEKISAFNEYLKRNNLMFVLKVHPLQADLKVFREKFSNILIINNEMLTNLGIQLYEFVALTDALVTDYSSIAVDYLLLDKPTVYTLDDYEEYDAARGVINGALELMKGYHVYTAEELEEAVSEIKSGADVYSDARKSVIGRFHSHIDGNASLRLTKYLNL